MNDADLSDFLQDLKSSMKRPMTESDNNNSALNPEKSASKKAKVVKNNFKPNNKQFKRKEKCFNYGNYDRYYGYRNPDGAADKRLSFFKLGWFDGKKVLDIGCNTGHITLSIAKDFNPSEIVGLDIDKYLVQIARKNIKHYEHSSDKPGDDLDSTAKIVSKTADGDKALQNVSFVQGNYVLENDALLELEQEQYDVILALSITKWVHLNFCDAGIKRFFRRTYKQLKPGGMLILEAQPWESYKKRSRLTPSIAENYSKIAFFPRQFRKYLLSEEVGFLVCNLVASAEKGFRRTLLQFIKDDGTGALVRADISDEAESLSPSTTTNNEQRSDNTESPCTVPGSADTPGPSEQTRAPDEQLKRNESLRSDQQTESKPV